MLLIEKDFHYYIIPFPYNYNFWILLFIQHSIQTFIFTEGVKISAWITQGGNYAVNIT